MASVGRISVLVSKELMTLVQALDGADAELKKQIGKHTRIVVGPVWKESVLGLVTTRLQTRVLGNTANVGVTAQSVFLRSARTGQLRRGVPASSLAHAVEFGAKREEYRAVRGKNGTYQRRTKRQFMLPRSRGYVVYPAARSVIPRILALWTHTAYRTIHEVLEKGGASRG